MAYSIVLVDKNGIPLRGSAVFLMEDQSTAAYGIPENGMSIIPDNVYNTAISVTLSSPGYQDENLRIDALRQSEFITMYKKQNVFETVVITVVVFAALLLGYQQVNHKR